MRVSIITACYNRATTIGDAIYSVGAQTHRAIEHIVVDGGSTDRTLEIIAREGRSVARVIPGPDKGAYDAFNKGIAAATGDVVAFLHSDDFYTDDRVVERVAGEMARHSLDVLYGDVAFVRADDLTRVVRVYSSRRFRPSRIGWGWMPAHPALFVRRHLFEEHGLFKTDYRIAADFEFVARIFSRPGLRYHYWPEVLVKMRFGGLSTRGWRASLTLNREVMRACRENGIATNYLKILSKYPAKAMEFMPGRARAAAE